jgi:uracil-DNA glycosylase
VSLRALKQVQQKQGTCTRCPNMVGPVVHGPAIVSQIYLLGQAPGPHEGKLGRPFAWTAGKTLFRWFHEALGVDEETFRARVYMSAVARCFPGKAPGGGDRKPDEQEMHNCREYIAGEVKALAPTLVIPVGVLAISQVLGKTEKLTATIGNVRQAVFHGAPVDVIALPHPSGASTWHRMEPGKTLLREALALLRAHPIAKITFA